MKIFSIFKSMFKRKPGAKIRKAISRKQAQAMHMQRAGKLREYAEITKEIEELENQYDEAVNES